MTHPVPAVPRLIHEAVADQARSRPSAVAIVHREERIDYATLDAAADAYASALHASGVRSGTLVPVLLPRTPQLVAVLLAVLKCGAAYAALDRRWPRERINQVSRLARPGIMVTDAAGAGACGEVTRWTVPDEPLRQAAARGDRPPYTRVDSAQPATIFFTSGSTGIPKGVLSPHRATMRLFAGRSFAEFGPGRTMLQTAPVSWDAFSLEVWGPLTSGGTCAIADTDYLLPEDLADLIGAANVDTAWLTSSLFNFLVDEDDPDRRCFVGLRHVLTGGERLSPTHVARFLARYPDIILTNGYGPAESCVFAATHRVAAADCLRPDGIPLGDAVSGTQVYIMDGNRVLPPGQVGEICLAGEGLALGYLGDAAATAAGFTSVRLDETVVRLYRTGDLGLREPDGTLHFRGRTDLQVKIAGHRIEPGEIESVARTIPGIRDAAVVPVPAAGGGFDRLAMFYTTDGHTPVTPATVRRALADKLPGYLVPQSFRHRTALPTTTTGKLDRGSLLASL